MFSETTLVVSAGEKKMEILAPSRPRARAMAREGRGWGRWMSRDAMDERDD